MSAAEVWPDGTPKRRGGFNAAVWNGEAPMVAPVDPVYGVGDVVACREPVDENGNPVVEGVVLWVDHDADTGEAWATIGRRLRRRRDNRYSDLKWEYRLERYPTHAFDPARHIASTVFSRGHTWQIAGQIAIAVGARYAFGAGRWTREDRLLLGAALQLADLAFEDAS